MNDTERSDIDLPDVVDRIVTDMAVKIVKRSINNAKDVEDPSTVRYDGSDMPNEITTEWSESAPMHDVFDVAEAGPLDYGFLVDEYLEQGYGLETSVRFYAAVNLQHLALDRLDAIC